MASKIDTLNRELRIRIKAGQANLWSHGNGLCFALSGNGKSTWVFRYTFDGKRRVMTLGPHNDPITDRQFKELEMVAIEHRDQVKAGIDPLIATKPKQSKTSGDDTFEDVARDYIATHSGNWRNNKHRAQWSSTLETYVYPKIGRKLPHEIGVDDVLTVLKQPHVRRGK
ncbi:Arm DNA-binding domain-containing protein, partial [Mesorhizobium sp.]|uniref:Arm DNA-binding domain-containing protein n=1 Tax=Mesorhizobium sp. TaxID=1871066 RepID=UPI0025FEF6C6